MGSDRVPQRRRAGAREGGPGTGAEPPAASFVDHDPDLFFRIFRGRTEIQNTRDAVLWNVRDADTRVRIRLDPADPEK